VTRLGGDEFIVLLPGVDALGAAYVAQKLLKTIAQPYQVEGYDLRLTASIGIALYPEDGVDLETLSKSADTAMYRAKQEGRQDYRFFTPEMQARSARNLQLMNALRQAIDQEQLFVHYQPQVSLQDGRIIGAEALIRWQHPEWGMVSPGEFIPLAEYSGLILPIGEWVLRRAVQQAKIWLEQGGTPIIMAVNLSAVQFRHPDLPNLVSSILSEAGLPPEYLELELTESVTMNNPQAAITVMSNLHERGIRMSIDDFGTGYSSLSYLKKFKTYKLKIDQSFVRDICTDAEDKAIVSAIISLAKSLGLKTIAEGVERVEQLAFLREQGCDEVQGYLFSKPVSAELFDQLRSQDFALL
jgi:EAL domain-containing protein (putative c-di-GMP-specific phosphodiesterase class I)